MRTDHLPSLVFLALATIIPLCAQTNTFPSSGNVGIGTTNPATLLTLNQSAGGNMLSFNGAGTNAEYQTFNSAGGTAYFGMEPSSGGSLNIGGAAYALSVVPAVSRKLQFGYSGGTGIAMTVDTTGNVGIGTTTPQAKLDVAGPIIAQSTLTTQGGATSYYGFGEVVGNTLSSNDLDSNRPALGPYGFYRINYHTGLSVSAHSYYGGIRFYNQGYAAGNSNPYDSSAGAVMVMAMTNGNVGVGITSPYSRFHVSQSIAEASAMSISTSALAKFSNTNNTTGNFSLLKFSGPDNDTSVLLGSALINASNGDSAFVLGVRDGGGTLTEKFRVTSGGNVGIGTTNPTQKLSVNGTIQAKEVIVQTGWSDYVFKPDYKLASLSEVEAHIKAHGTLPGVPSEAQVAKEGVSMGEMQSKLLAKIEELTLHQIQQEKEISALKAEVIQLRKNSAP